MGPASYFMYLLHSGVFPMYLFPTKDAVDPCTYMNGWYTSIHIQVHNEYMVLYLLRSRIQAEQLRYDCTRFHIF